MKESFSNKGYFPNRINSAPPDEGEPHLKTSLNLLANEFKPVGLANVLSIKPQNYQKKNLRADAIVYEPSSKLSANSEPFIFNFSAPAFVFDSSSTKPIIPNHDQLKSPVIVHTKAINNIPLPQIPKPDDATDIFAKVLSNPNIQEFVPEPKKETTVEPFLSEIIEKAHFEPIISSEKPPIVEIIEEKPSIVEVIEEKASPIPLNDEEETKEENEIQQEKIVEEEVYKKKVYNLDEIKSLKLSFVKDPNFLIISEKLSQIKDRKVDIIKIYKGKKGDDKRIVREPQIIGQALWRKAKTAEEEKISKKAKEYSQRFLLPSAEQEKIKKQVRITLNKLSPNNLDKLSKDILETCKKSHDYLKLVVLGIFEKAWSETKYTQMYSTLCKFLKNSFEKFSYPGQENSEFGGKNLFKYELLYVCEETFKYNPSENDFTGLSNKEREEKLEKIKKKTLGNVRFIGELFNVNLITAKIILECVNSLLDLFERENNEDKLEGACVLLLTGAASFERDKLLVSTNEIYKRLARILEGSAICSKNRFKIIDLQEFRASGWRNLQKGELKKIEEIHADFQNEQNEILKRHGYNN